MAQPMIGMMMSSTIDVTILLKAAPMMTPMARSKALPLKAKSLNSCHMLLIPSCYADDAPVSRAPNEEFVPQSRYG